MVAIGRREQVRRHLEETHNNARPPSVPEITREDLIAMIPADELAILTKYDVLGHGYHSILRSEALMRIFNVARPKPPMSTPELDQHFQFFLARLQVAETDTELNAIISDALNTVRVFQGQSPVELVV